MRVLSVVQFYFPFQDRGGPVFKVRSLAKGLAKRGHQVTVLTADLGLSGVNGFVSKAAHCEWGWRWEEEGVETIYLATRARFRASTLNPGVVGYCKASLQDFDVAHFYGLYDLLGPIAAYFCRQKGIPYVVEPMGMYRPIDRSLLAKHFWHRLIGRAFLTGAARIIATSQIERRELLDGGVPAAKVAVRYNGIDLSSCLPLPSRGTFRSKWKISPEEHLVLFLSRLIPRKGADILIDAFARACPESARLVIAGPEGEAGYRAYLEKRASAAGLGERVVFTGPLYDDDKKAAFADADVFVLPSRYENFGNTVAEAVASGVPVIVTNDCGVSPLVEGRAGIVIRPEEPVLAEALRTLIYDERLHARLKEGCQRVADELTWESLIEQMENYYVHTVSRLE